MNIGKFALWAYNNLAYNYEISGPLVENILLYLLEFYTFERTIKRVNLQAFCLRFPKVIFNKVIKTDLADNFICFGRSKKISTSFFDNYYFKRLELKLYFFYDYQKTIIVVKFIFKIEGDIVFNYNHPNPKKKV